MSEDLRTIDPLVDRKAAVRDLGDRLERDYHPRVIRFAAGFGTWGSSTIVGYEIPLGGRIGAVVGGSRRYARRTGLFGLLGPRKIIKDLPQIESELRQEIEAWLSDQERRSGPSGASGGDAI
jgi:hypothetical protein